jgi:hypothetical protein
VIVPPVWNLVVTATLQRRPSLSDQLRLENALHALEAAYSYSPAGLFACVGYGLPYLRTYIRPELLDAHLPRMVDTGASVLLDAIRFATDDPYTVLEANDVVFHLRSDTLEHLHDVQRALFGRSGSLNGQPAPAADLSDLFLVTSVRTGFIGPGLPRRMAEQAGLAVVSEVPADAPLFMGFTSTQRLGQAVEPAAAHLTSAKTGDYFAGGTTLHLSHLIEDLDGWYRLPYEQRLARMFHPTAIASVGRITVPTTRLTPNPSATDAERGVLGHTAAIQRGSRSATGEALHLRVDFNTMDAMNSSRPGPGVHFLSLTAGSQIFHASRRAMDAADLADPHSIVRRANGINGFIGATRRQNYLVPPRRHRAFPLLELSS